MPGATDATFGAINCVLQVCGLPPAPTTTGRRALLGPTSNDAGDPSPIADLFANADRAWAGPANAAALRSPLWIAPSPC